MARDTRPERASIFWVDQAPKRYGCLSFLGDVFMTILTSGFWLIWIFIREVRRR